MRKHLVLLAVAVSSFSVFGKVSRPKSGKIGGAHFPPLSNGPTGSDALPPDAPTRDQVMTLLDQLQARRSVEAAMNQMKTMMKESAEESFRQKRPNATAKEVETLRGVIDDAVGVISLDEMINAVIPIYQRHLSKTDLEELIRFYSSPVGQKMIREQPQIMQESMQAGAEVARKHMDEIMTKVDRRVQELDTDQTHSSK